MLILLTAMASSSILPFTCFVFLFTTTTLSTTTDNFTFNGFKEAGANLTLRGASKITSNDVLQLTNDSQNVLGHAFFTSAFHMLDNHKTTAPSALSFSTNFVFDIRTIGRSGGQGFTFAISPSKTLPNSDHSQYLGLLNKENNGKLSNHIFAVEFDTDQLQVPGSFADIDDNHVGVDIDSLMSNVSESAAYYSSDSKKEEVQLESGSPIQAWIDYDGVGKILNVTIAPIPITKPHKPLISQAIDLSPILKETMYVGFTASTGKPTSSHYILGWSFQLNGEARALDLSQLPSPPKVKGNSQRPFGVKIGVASFVATLLAGSLVIFVSLYLRQRAKLAESLEEWELNYPHRFRYKDLYRATKGFKATELLGSGGFGQVYKGLLPESREEVAIKRISNSSRQGVQEFVAEIASLGRLRHRNLVQLHGWCKRDKDLILIYEFMINSSLDTFLFDCNKSRLLNWEQRFKIVKDIALGLLYLHEEWEQVIVHRDIKASNILLDGEMNGKLGDFGLARLYEHRSNPQTTHVVGTVGYIAPELSRTGKATDRSDVFAYGTLLLEVVCGKRPMEPNAFSGELLLLDWVRACWTKGKLFEVVDLKLGGLFVKEEVELVLQLGLICSQSAPDARPTMRQVTQYLNGHEILADNTTLVFSEADSWDLASRSWNSASRSYPSSSGGILSTSSFQGGEGRWWTQNMIYP